MLQRHHDRLVVSRKHHIHVSRVLDSIGKRLVPAADSIHH